MSREASPDVPALLGHPTGLFTLFFAEMWERFSYYGMRALLTLYMIKGFLSYSDDNTYRVYGAYTALVYMTPFFGGIIADRLIGSRRSVILGGLLMASGQLMLTFDNSWSFFSGLAFLICGNGFFKPNISTMVGALYPARSKLRDAGFTIFYIGVNLGAAAAPLLCSAIGETYGYQKGFGLAVMGMLLGLAVFVAPNVISQLLLIAASVMTGYSLFGNGLEGSILREVGGVNLTWLILGLLITGGVFAVLGLRSTLIDSPAIKAIGRPLGVALILAGAAVGCYGMLRLYDPKENLIIQLTQRPGEDFTRFVDLFVVLFLAVSAIVSSYAVFLGGLPRNIGMPPADRPLSPGKEWLTYGLALLAVPMFMYFVSGFDPGNQKKGDSYSLVSKEYVKGIEEHATGLMAQPGLGNQLGGAVRKIGAVFLGEFGTPAGICLFAACLAALIYIFSQMKALSTVAWRRMFVALVLCSLSVVFWALFEQAGSSISVFTDRNVERMTGSEKILADSDIGTTIEFQPTQAQLGYTNGDRQFTMNQLDLLRKENESSTFTIPWTVAADNVGMRVCTRAQEVGAAKYQAVNPAFILIFGLLFTVVWSWLATRNIEPGSPMKFALGLFQLGLGFLVFWYGATQHDSRGMVWVGWIFLGYLLHTTGELCLSPVGLSAMTKLAARHLVSTLMGIWFLCTAMSQFLAGVIAQFTQVQSQPGVTPPPSDTVMAYGNVFGILGLMGIAVSVFALCLVPLLNRWMYEDVVEAEDRP